MPAEQKDDERHEPILEGEETPPRGVKAMALVRWGILAFAVMVALFMWGAYALEHTRAGRSGAGSASAQAPTYRCPMHPQVVSSEPGECPICHMDLVRIVDDTPPDDGRAPSPAASTPLVIVDDSGPLTYGCPMDPEVRSARPGRCPICKMALEPLPEASATHVHGGADLDAGDAGPRAMSAPGSLPPGTTPIKLALDRIQSIGVRTAVAEEGATSASLHVTAVVQEPEQGASQVHVRTPGFVEAMHVDQTGNPVRAGQPLLSIYSPELLQAQNELLATRAWTNDAGAVSAAAESKLGLLGMTEADIARVLERREPMRRVMVVAPGGGFVTKKNVVLGSYVTPEMTLYEIQDLSRVYVVADVFLRDLPAVAVGTEARFVPSGHPSDVTMGKIDLLYPVVSAEARTRRVRMQIPNEGGRRFAPGEYGVVELSVLSRRAVTIPRDALVDTGAATYVFIAAPEGRFEPRVVTMQGFEGERVLIGAGLRAGERVVSGATFLIDSESRLQASVSQAGALAPPPAHEHGN